METLKKEDVKEWVGIQTHTVPSEILRVGTVLEGGFYAQLLYPLPERTTVRFYGWNELDGLQLATARAIKRCEDAWDRATGRKKRIKKSRA